jgi:hypothetical protein
VGTVGGGQDVAFTRARVIGSGPSAADSAKPTAVRVAGFPGIAPRTVERLTSATIGFNFSNGVTGAVPRPGFWDKPAGPPLRSAMAASGLPNGSYAASRALTRATVAAVHTAAPAGVGKPSAVSFPASCRSDNEPSGSSRVMIGASEAA